MDAKRLGFGEKSTSQVFGLDFHPYFRRLQFSYGTYFIVDLHIVHLIKRFYSFAGTVERTCRYDGSKLLRNAINCSYYYYLFLNKQYIISFKSILNGIL